MEDDDQDELPIPNLPIQPLEAILDMIDHRMYKEKPQEVNRGKDNDIIKITLSSSLSSNTHSVTFPLESHRTFVWKRSK